MNVPVGGGLVWPATVPAQVQNTEWSQSFRVTLPKAEQQHVLSSTSNLLRYSIDV